MKEAMDQDPYGLVDNGGDYNSVMGFWNEGPCIFAMRLQPNQPNLPREAGHLSQLTPCLSSVSWIEVTLHPSCSKLSMYWLLPIRNTWMALLLSICRMNLYYPGLLPSWQLIRCGRLLTNY
jgi:hypothetical protein